MKFAKKVNRTLKSCFGLDLYRCFNSIRNRFLSGQRVDIETIGEESGLLKLHLGCGERYFKGYVNIDLRKTSATDLVCDISKLPFSDNSVERIEIYHVVEHLPRHDFPKALKEWRRVLVEGGKLIIEYPDFDTVVKEYIAGNEKRLDNIFGMQRFRGDTHLFGYNFTRMKKTLEDCGYKEVKSCEPTDYHRLQEPCLRVEACK